MADIRKLIQTGPNRDTLRSAFPILNMVIDSAVESATTANEAKTQASSAVQTANEANAKSDDTQQQLNNIVLFNGESDAEVLQARGTYSVLNERLQATDAQLADEATKIGNRDIFIQKANTSPKAIQNINGTIMVVTRKAHGNGYIRLKLAQNVYTTTVSSGSPAELLRVVEVLDVPECFALKHVESANSNASLWTTLNVNYVIEGVGQQSLECRAQNAKTANSWIEYTVDVPKGISEIEALIYKSSSSSANVTISVDGVDTLLNQNFTGSGFGRISIPVLSGRHTIRFTTLTSAYMNIAGVNVIDLNRFKPGYNYDRLVTIYNSNNNKYITADGAMEYALLDGDTDLWCGSVHGGEVRNRVLYLLDGKTLALNNGSINIGNVFEIEQDTTIVNKINAYSTQRFESDGSVEHSTVFEGNINLKTLFTNMTTALDTYEEIVYPSRASMTDKEKFYFPTGINYVIQRDPTNNQKIITVMNNKMIPSNANNLPYVKKLTGVYNKLYLANIQSETPVNFTGGNFKTTHVFE